VYLNELAQVGKSGLLGLGKRGNDGEHRIDDGLLVLVSALIAEHVGERGHEGAMLLLVLEAQSLNGVHHDDLELVRDVVDKVGDLLHQAVDSGLGASLEQGGNGQRGDGAVHVADEVLHVGVAHRDGERMGRRHLVERAHCSEPEAGLGRAEEHLQHSHSRRELLGRHGPQAADAPGSLVDHHLALVSQTALEIVVETAALPAKRGKEVQSIVGERMK
jgi:hypothetical protein